jgi:hypothetical protein
LPAAARQAAGEIPVARHLDGLDCQINPKKILRHLGSSQCLTLLKISGTVVGPEKGSILISLHKLG